jgi:site-specific recombinase XerD
MGAARVERHSARRVERAGHRVTWAAQGRLSLRHTFCSHLAMGGAPARAIQELAGHQDLMTTQRYRHLSPAALEAAIRLLDRPGMSPVRGEILEAAGKQGCF